MQSQSVEPQRPAGCDVIVAITPSSRGWALADDPALFDPGDTLRSIEMPIRTSPPGLAETTGRGIGVSSGKRMKCESKLIGH